MCSQDYLDPSDFPAVEFDYTPSSKHSAAPASDVPVKRQRVKTTKADAEQVSKRKINNKREKVEKLIAKKNHKNIQPGECMNFVQVELDEGLEHFNFFQESQVLLNNAKVKTRKKSLLVPASLMWTRFTEINSVTSDNDIDTRVREEEQPNLMIVWNWDEVVEKIANECFRASLMNIGALVPDKKLSLVIYGIEEYFSYHKGGKRKKLGPMYRNIQETPKISRKEFECSLVDVQIGINCQTTQIENSTDMGLMILQYTKAIAEIPYKMAMRETEVDKMDFYAIGDNKNTIKIDAGGFGLKRLWLRQLCLFNNAGLAIAETIYANYPSPMQLMKAYMQCSSEDGEGLLKDIPIRRGASEGSSGRRIGLELSRKIYRMLTSMSGEQLLK